MDKMNTDERALVGCKVAGCTMNAEIDGTYCQECWSRLPEAIQRAVSINLRRMSRDDLGPLARREAQDVIAQCSARLACELQGAPTAEEIAEGDQLTRMLHSFNTFAELVNSYPGYWPKLRCSRIDEPNEQRRRANERLADLYDRAQKSKSDPRRATRLGCAGL